MQTLRKQTARPYCFVFSNRDGSHDNYEPGDFNSDPEAERQARAALLVSTTATSVEVWSEGQRLANIRRDDTPRRSFPLRF